MTWIPPEFRIRRRSESRPLQAGRSTSTGRRPRPFCARSRAVRHPFLITLATGGFESELARSLVDSRTPITAFPLDSPRTSRRSSVASNGRHTELRLSENLAEERGRLDPEAAATLRDLGIAIEDARRTASRSFRALPDAVSGPPTFAPTPGGHRSGATLSPRARDHAAAFGVGALGIASESIVAPTYAQILAGLAGVEDLDRRDLVFFELHCHVDDHHQEDLLQIARDLAEEPGGAEALERGARVSLSLRAAFWDALYASCLDRTQRAREPSPQELLHA